MTATQTMTADQLFDRSPELGRCELIHGELTVMSPAGGGHGKVAAKIAFYLQQWANDHGGGVYGAETGFVLERHPDTVRAPDAAWVSPHRAAEAETMKFIPIAPDFAAEVLSPNDKAEQVAAKVQWWLDHGVRLVWVADPANACVTAHLPNGDAHVYRDRDTITAGEVMPGLNVAVNALFG